MQSLNLPLEVIRDLMFGYPVYWGEKPQSVIASNEAHRPVQVPPEIGELLEIHDDETHPLFHIEHFGTHSEVWHSYEWSLSTSRKLKIIQLSQERSNKYLAVQTESSRLQTIYTQIKAIISTHYPAWVHKSNEKALDNMIRVLMSSPKEITDTIHKDITKLLYGTREN